jgi:hypothetical protein
MMTSKVEEALETVKNMGLNRDETIELSLKLTAGVLKDAWTEACKDISLD